MYGNAFDFRVMYFESNLQSENEVFTLIDGVDGFFGHTLNIENIRCILSQNYKGAKE